MFIDIDCICQKEYKVILGENNIVLNENEVSPKQEVQQMFPDSSIVLRVYSDCPHCGEENINLK